MFYNGPNFGPGTILGEQAILAAAGIFRASSFFLNYLVLVLVTPNPD
jgi:hypothetical protein